MSKKLPYMSAPNGLTKILNKVKEAAVPSVFNRDFLSTVLGFKGGNDATFISWAKKCGILNTDGSPTDLYKKFRNPATSKTAIASAIRIGYEDLFKRNEFAHKLEPQEIKGHIIEITGVEADNRAAEMTKQTFMNALAFADFESDIEANEEIEEQAVEPSQTNIDNELKNKVGGKSNLKLGLNYTINIVLPKSDDPKVYSAIFSSLKENLLDS